MVGFKINFTKQTIINIKPPKLLDGKRVACNTYHDIKHKGLILLVSNGGAKTFYLYVKIQGKPERIKIGRFPDIAIEQARKIAHKYKGEIVQGINPNKKKITIKTELTLKELFEQYIQRYAKKHRKTWKENKAYYDRYLVTYNIKDCKLSTINRSMLEKIHNEIGDKYGYCTANRLVELLRAIFNKAIEWGWEGKNPTIGIKKFKEKSRDRFLQLDELPRFYKALFEEENTAIRDYIFISLMTGARKSNVLSMRWDEVKLHDDIRQWRIPETKNGEPLTIPLNDDAVELLKARKEQVKSDWVFPSSASASGHLEEPKKGWKRILDRAGIKDLRLHDLRRTYGSWQAMTGSSTAIIGKSLGHKNKNTTAIYERLNLDPVRLSMNKATDAMTKDSRDVINKIIGRVDV